NQFQTVPTAAYRNGDFRQALVFNKDGSPKLLTNPQGVPFLDPAGRTMQEGQIYNPATTRLSSDGKLFRDPFDNNIIPPQYWDPVALKIQALFPQPAGPNFTDLTQNYIEVYPTSRVTEVPSFKVDQFIGKGKLSFFWQRTQTTNPNGNTIFGRSDGLPDPISEVLGTFQNAPLYR